MHTSFIFHPEAQSSYHSTQTIQWFLILFRVKSKVLVQAKRPFLIWPSRYFYDLIFYCCPSCLFCSSHTGLLGEPKPCQTCSSFWVFVLVVSSAYNACSSDIHMTYTLLPSCFSSNVIFFMKPSLSIPCIKEHHPLFSTLSTLSFCFIFLCNTYDGKKKNLYANFLSSPFQNEGSSSARALLIKAGFPGARRKPDT